MDKVMRCLSVIIPAILVACFATAVLAAPPVSASKSTVVASPASIPANGTTTSTITVTINDTAGNPVSGKTVTLAAGSGSSTIITVSGTTNASGVATFTVKDSVAESVIYTATDTTDGITVTQTATVTFTRLTAPTVAKSFSPTSIAANGTSTLTITLTNPNTTAISGLAFTDTYPSTNLKNATTPTLTNTCGGTATGTAGASALSLSGGSIAGSSSCTLTVQVTSAVAGSYVNTTGLVTSTNANSGTAASATLTVTAISAANSTVAASPTSVPADNSTTSTITVTLKDGVGNGVSGKTVTLAAGSGSSTISAASGPSNASGVVTFTVKDSVAELVTYTALDTTDSVTVMQTASVTFTALTTTLATGTDPAAATIAPGAAATDVDLFTFQTSGGTEAITSVTVNLSTSNGVGRLAITNNAGTELGFTTSPVTGSNTITVAGMSATTTLTTFKVRVTPLSHAAMPVPPGAAYAITAPVIAWAGPNTHSGSDTNSNALTIDNLSPSGATATSASAGNAKTTLNWTTSASSDFSRSVMLRWTGGAAGAEVPAEGTYYVNGNTIGTATVVCVRTADAAATAVSGIDGAGTGGCSATALTNGQAYTYKIFQQDTSGNYDTGVIVGSVTPVAAVSSFNAFETSTAAGAITGVIKTKIAGSAFSLDVVAISGGAQSAGFTDTVKVELLGNTVTGIALDAQNCPTSSTLLQTINPATITAGRSTVNFAAVADAWKDVRVRISYPAAAPPVTTCSTDNFAIRPNSLSVSVTDTNWQTAGTARTLGNSGATGGNVHKAGQPFTIIATAQNAVGATTTNYAGGPTVKALACTLPVSTCTSGILTPGTWSGNGTVTTSTASYNEAGAFNLTLEDQTFAGVDSADSTLLERTIPQTAAVLVGRFVPDHFDVTVLITPIFKTFNAADAACSAGAAPRRTFTYIGQSFGYLTAPQATILARNAAGATAVNYQGTGAGGLWKVAASDITQTYSNNAVGPSLDTTLTGAPSVTDNLNGTGTVAFAAADKLAYQRSTAVPSALFNANISLAVSAQDATENVANQGIITSTATALFNGTGSGIDFDGGGASNGKEFRYGRLKFSNAHGSELLNLPVPIQTQYWNGTAFVINAADNCTTLATSNIKLTTTLTGVSATVGGAFSSGAGSLTLTKPTPAAKGVVALCVDLDSSGTGDTTCIASTPAAMPYLHTGTAYDKDPTAQATFGVYKGSNQFIYMRENY